MTQLRAEAPQNQKDRNIIGAPNVKYSVKCMMVINS